MSRRNTVAVWHHLFSAPVPVFVSANSCQNAIIPAQTDHRQDNCYRRGEIYPLHHGGTTENPDKINPASVIISNVQVIECLQQLEPAPRNLAHAPLPFVEYNFNRSSASSCRGVLTYCSARQGSSTAVSPTEIISLRLLTIYASD